MICRQTFPHQQKDWAPLSVEYVFCQYVDPVLENQVWALGSYNALQDPVIGARKKTCEPLPSEIY